MLFPRFRLQVPLSVLSLLSIVLLVGLAACADNSTPTQAATTPASTTVAATVGGSSTGIAVNGSKLNVTGTTPLTLDPTLEKALKDLLSVNSTRVPDLSLTIYASNDEPPILGDRADKTLTGAGYTFHDVRGGTDTVLNIKDADGAGAYTKNGVPDLIIEVREATALSSANGAPPGVSADAYQKMLDQVKDKKSILIVLSGSNLFQIITDARNNSPVGSNSPGAATATPAPTK